MLRFFSLGILIFLYLYFAFILSLLSFYSSGILIICIQDFVLPIFNIYLFITIFFSLSCILFNLKFWSPFHLFILRIYLLYLLTYGFFCLVLISEIILSFICYYFLLYYLILRQYLHYLIFEFF